MAREMKKTNIGYFQIKPDPEIEQALRKKSTIEEKSIKEIIQSALLADKGFTEYMKPDIENIPEDILLAARTIEQYTQGAVKVSDIVKKIKKG